MKSSIYLGAALLVALGCNSQKPTGAGNQTASAPQADTVTDVAPPKEDSAVRDQPETADEVAVEIKDLDGIRELIASKKGKVAVMDCWSTWCDPCIKEFPGLVELHKKYGTDQVACISLSFDYGGGKNDTPEEHQEDVLAFLRSQGAAFDNVIASVPADELYKPLGFTTGSIPAIFVFDREGNVARQFEGAEARYSEVEKFVAELLEQPSDESP